MGRHRSDVVFVTTREARRTGNKKIIAQTFVSEFGTATDSNILFKLCVWMFRGLSASGQYEGPHRRSRCWEAAYRRLTTLPVPKNSGIYSSTTCIWRQHERKRRVKRLRAASSRPDCAICRRHASRSCTAPPDPLYCVSSSRSVLLF